MVEIIIICIFVYVFSAIYSWNWIRRAHSKDGRWSGVNVRPDSLMMAYVPILNTIFALNGIFDSPISSNEENSLSKHFNIKK
jgi:hypothetical protein